MSRRKTIFYGKSLNERLETCLGFPEYERAGELLGEIDFEVPKIDWFSIESACDHEISAYSREEIDLAFEAEIGFRVRKAITQKLSGPMPEDETSEAEFLRKADRIASLAQKLTQEIDELAEIGSALILRPLRKDGLTSVEEPEEFYAKVTGKTEPPTSDCFADYYSFRKMLDYYASFAAMSGDFQSLMGDRFDRMLDYSWYEMFVRRVVLALWPTSFPMTVTIPTDTNIGYASPIILVLEELRRQFNELAEHMPGLSDMREEWSYRQHARLVLKLREDFEKSEIFWAQVQLRKYDADQSAFGKNEL
jgi:hypothetical protein